MKTYRAAVIGLGRMGSTFDDEMGHGGTLFRPYCHGPTYATHPTVDLVAGADMHDEQRTLFGQRWGLSSDHLYRDYKKMLDVERPDIVSVATSARIRSTIVRDVARAGVKIIWAEKPIALSLAEADSMVQVCREAGVTFAVNCARRWMHGYSGARRLIEAGELGKILQVTAHYPCGLSINGSHLIDTVRYLTGGEVVWVFGEMESDEAAASEADISGNGYLAFDNGVRAFLRTMGCGNSEGRSFQVIGEAGQIFCRERPVRFELVRLEAFIPAGDSDHEPQGRIRQPTLVSFPIPLPPRMEGTGIGILSDLIEAHELGRSPRVCGEDGLKALEIAIAMRESHRRGGVKVRLPLADRSLRIVSSDSVGDALPKRLRRKSERAR